MEHTFFMWLAVAAPYVFMALLFGSLFALARWDMKAVAKKARADALAEAEEVLLGPARAARRTAAHYAEQRLRSVDADRCMSRAYHYERAALFVASIPKDRI